MNTTRAPLGPASTIPSRVQSLANFPAVTWRNGLGTTREIASASSAQIPDWRISIATLRGDEPFSVLPGIDRVLVPLVLGSIGLISDGGPLPVSAGGAIRFDGAREVRAINLSGAEEHQVLNVMTLANAGGLSDRVALRMLLVTGPYVSTHPGTVCVVVRSGEVVTGDGRVFCAPAIVPARQSVSAHAADLIEIILTTADPMSS